MRFARKKPIGFRVRPKSRESIRSAALAVREELGIGGDRFDGEYLIDLLGAEFGITVDITEDNDLLEGSEAFCDPGRCGLLPVSMTPC